MASGDTLAILMANDNQYSGSSAGTFVKRNEHLAVALSIIDEYVIFSRVLPRIYDGGGITVYMHYAMEIATSNDIRLDTTFERVGDQQQDIDSDGFDATGVNGTDTTVPGTAGLVDIVNNVHSDGARIDNIAVGEGFRLKVTRTTVAGTDATGLLHLLYVELKET